MRNGLSGEESTDLFVEATPSQNDGSRMNYDFERLQGAISRRLLETARPAVWFALSRSGEMASGSGNPLTVETCLNETARSGSLTGKVLRPIGGEVKRKPRNIE
jgi:hypothetical protein